MPLSLLAKSATKSNFSWEDSIYPFIHGTTAPSGPWPPSKVASILPYFPLFSSILASLISVMRPSAQHPPIWFLVFPLVLCYGLGRFGQWFLCLQWIPRFITMSQEPATEALLEPDDIVHPRILFLRCTLVLSYLWITLKKFLWADKSGDGYKKRYSAVIRASPDIVVVGWNGCRHFGNNAADFIPGV